MARARALAPILLALVLAVGPVAAQGRPLARPTLPGDAVPAGWTLRVTPDATPIAMLDGPGNIRHLALFCLSGEPFLALFFRAPPTPETLRLAFSFADARFEGEARRESGAGGAHVLALRDQPLASLLAGHDAEVDLAIDGAKAGRLTLRGSSKAIHAALAPCDGL